MGVMTDFLVANQDELHRAFPKWVAVAESPVMTEFTNPFTGKKQSVLKWIAADDKPVNVSEQRFLDRFRDLPNAQFKRVEHFKLASLIEILTGIGEDDSLQTLERPALLNPSSDGEEGLNELPRAGVIAIADMSAAELPSIAAQWVVTEEMEADMFTMADCEEVLRELNRLAKLARDSRSGLYLCWSL